MFRGANGAPIADDPRLLRGRDIQCSLQPMRLIKLPQGLGQRKQQSQTPTRRRLKMDPFHRIEDLGSQTGKCRPPLPVHMPESGDADQFWLNEARASKDGPASLTKRLPSAFRTPPR